MSVPFDTVFATGNGFNLYISTEVGAIQAQWVVEAFESCSFDPLRLQAVCTGRLGVGAATDFYIHIGTVDSDAIPGFGEGEEYTGQGYYTDTWGRAYINIWNGLASNRPPYGGRRFYRECVIHALGHIVGEGLGYSIDPWKRLILADALGRDIPGAGDGPGPAWQAWQQDGLRPWNMRLTERFAEVFKDVFMPGGVRRFTNRTRCPLVSPQIIWLESQSYLPIAGGFFLRPGVGGNGWAIEMGAHTIPPKSFQGSCFGSQYVCVDPCGITCDYFPCGDKGNYQTGPYCGQYFAYPCGAQTAFSYGVSALIPALPFCEHTSVLLGGAIAGPGGTMEYDCPKSITPSNDPKSSNLVTWCGCEVLVERYAGGPIISSSRDPGIGVGTRTMWGWGNYSTKLTIDVSNPHDFAHIAQREDGRTDGWDFDPGGDMSFLAGEFGETSGYYYYIGNWSRIYAPSAGVYENPYSAMSLDGVDSGGAVAPVASGREGQALEFDVGGVPGGYGDGNMVIG